MSIVVGHAQDVVVLPRPPASAGETDGDGLADLVVGPNRSGAGGTHAGAACLMFGN
jgi:hypothetical protein